MAELTIPPKFREHAESAVAVKTAAATLEVWEQVVKVDTTSGTFKLRLPDVAAAIGRIYSIDLIGGETTACTLAPHRDSATAGWGGDYTLDANDDAIVLYSDGRRWHVLANNIAA